MRSLLSNSSSGNVEPQHADRPSCCLQVGYFSMLIDDTLDSGTSRATRTYGAPCLASSEHFEIDTVECWRVEPPTEEEVAEKRGRGGTAMDAFGEDKFLLEMDGRRMHSDGVRNAPPADDVGACG